MNILQTLKAMKPDIKVLIWDNDINRIEYNETEDFRPSKEEILSFDQKLVLEEAPIVSTNKLVETLTQQVVDLKNQLDKIKLDVTNLKTSTK